MNKENPLVNDSVYHIVSRSIAKFQIYNSDDDYSRMVQLLRFYQIAEPPTKYSMFLKLEAVQLLGFDQFFNTVSKGQKHIVQIIAYCFMPNHIHLVLKQLEDKGISTFMSNILNSYTRYFNLLHKRKGPLWESRFKHILVNKDEQLLHLTRYIHLNPTSAKLVEKPELWKYSSYLEYIRQQQKDLITNYEGLMDVNPKLYKSFVNDRKDYQQKLSVIKRIAYL